MKSWLIFLVSLLAAIIFSENTGQGIFWIILFGPIFIWQIFSFCYDNDLLEFLYQIIGLGILILLAYSFLPKGTVGQAYQFGFLVLILLYFICIKLNNILVSVNQGIRILESLEIRDRSKFDKDYR